MNKTKLLTAIFLSILILNLASAYKSCNYQRLNYDNDYGQTYTHKYFDEYGNTVVKTYHYNPRRKTRYYYKDHDYEYREHQRRIDSSQNYYLKFNTITRTYKEKKCYHYPPEDKLFYTPCPD